jgi:hypothetical protein
MYRRVTRVYRVRGLYATSRGSALTMRASPPLEEETRCRSMFGNIEQHRGVGPRKPHAQCETH